MIEAQPLLGIDEDLTDLLGSQAKRKPQVVAFTGLVKVGKCYIHGFACPSYEDLLRDSPFAD